MAAPVCAFTEWSGLSDRIDRIFTTSPKLPLSSEYYAIARRLFYLVRWSSNHLAFQYVSPYTLAEFTRVLQYVKYTIDTFRPLNSQLAASVLNSVTRLGNIIDNTVNTITILPRNLRGHAHDAAIAAALSAASMFERYVAAEDSRVYDMCDYNEPPGILP